MTANILAKNRFLKSHTLCNGEEYDDDNDDDVNDNDDISDNDNAGDDCDGDDYISADWAKQTIVRKGPTTIKERRRLSRKTRCFNLDDVAESLRTMSLALKHCSQHLYQI